MDRSTLRRLAGLPSSLDNILTTAQMKSISEGEEPQSLHFGLKDESNVKNSCVLIAHSGVPVDMEYFMGIYYFNFKDRKSYNMAIKAITGKIDTSKEDELKLGKKN